ncbi:MAG: hypothetical protein ACKVS6_12295 [Planctomycetota bacterium]
MPTPSRPFRILSDFDGVWTNQAFEASQVKLYLAAEASRIANVSADFGIQHFARFETIVKSRPHEFGWAPDGRITAYVDEDPFCESNAIAGYITKATGDAEAKLYRDAILGAGFSSIASFSDHCFLTATAHFRAEHPPALVANATETLRQLHQIGAEVIVVSNSSAEKILGWFGAVGVDISKALSNDAPHGVPFRVRGTAGKQFIGEKNTNISVGGRSIFIDRPRYKTIIEEEKPDLIIGDVFSLDLALPSILRRERNPAAPKTLVLRKHPHTPRWIMDTKAEGAIDAVVDDVFELVALVQKLTTT